MNTINKLKTLLQLILGFFPTPVPIGMTTYKAWTDSIISLYGLPDNNSVRWAIASVVLHLGPQAAFRSKFFFYCTIRAGAAKQIAGAVFQEIKVADALERQKQLDAETAAQNASSAI